MLRYLIPTIFIFTYSLNASDIYKLSYDNKDHNCTLTKNSKPVELFDPRFEKKKPRSSYTCFAIQKELYNDCKRVDYSNTSAQMLSFGSYDYTNLVIAFQNPHESVASSMTVECTKELPKSNKKTK